MKRFSCGDVVPGCKATFTGKDESDVLSQVADHARNDHGIQSVSPELVDAVRARIHDVTQP